MKDALVKLNKRPDEVLVVGGIGQAAKTAQFIQTNFFHGLHGRALPSATGAKLANHELTVIVNSGDGDCYGEGGNHFMNAIRRNVNLTLLVHDNKVYGLTKGQASPTSDLGFVTKMQVKGVVSERFNPLLVALSLGAGFVARGFSNDRVHTSRLIQDAINYRGFALINIMTPCVTYNKINTHSYYKKRATDLYDTDYVPDDLDKAMKMVQEEGDQMPIGIFYQKEKPILSDRIDVLKDRTLLSREFDSQAVQNFLDKQ
jgi:2-oxoglutarate ferredoxin oxidoreductase subunit beta